MRLASTPRYPRIVECFACGRGDRAENEGQARALALAHLLVCNEHPLTPYRRFVQDLALKCLVASEEIEPCLNRGDLEVPSYCPACKAYLVDAGVRG